MKYWRNENRLKSKFEWGLESSLVEEVRIHVSRDEWRDVYRFLNYSMSESDTSPTGHIYVSIDGARRDWVTTDDVQIAVRTSEGPRPVGEYDRSKPLGVLLHSGLFRTCDPVDAVISLGTKGGRRVQSLRREGMSASFDAPVGKFRPWQNTLSRIEGPTATVDAGALLEACHLASSDSRGCHDDDPVSWLCIRDGELLVEHAFDSTSPTLRLNVQGASTDSAPVLFNPERMAGLVHGLGSGIVKVTIPCGYDVPIGVTAHNFRGALMPINQEKPVRENLESMLKSVLQLDSLKADEDGDYSVESPRGQQLWIRLHTRASPMSLQIFSVIATDVVSSAGLMEELNAINANSAYVKLYYIDGALIAEADLVAQSLHHVQVANALSAVEDSVGRYRAILGAWFGTSPTAEEIDWF